MKAFINHPQPYGRLIRYEEKSLEALGLKLQLRAQQRDVIQVNEPDEVGLLCHLSWDGVHEFAEHYGLEVKCRARGAAFDFNVPDSDQSRRL